MFFASEMLHTFCPIASEASLYVHDLWAIYVYARNFEISLRRRGIVYECMCIVIVNGARMLRLFLGNDKPISYEVKNSCFLVDWSFRLPFSLREGEWVCHDDSLVFNLGKCGNEQCS